MPKAALPKPFRFLAADSLLRLQRTGHLAHTHRHQAPGVCWQPGLGKEDEEVPCQEPSPSSTLPWVRRTARCSLPLRSIQAPSGSVNGNRQSGTRTVFCSFSWTYKKSASEENNSDKMDAKIIPVVRASAWEETFFPPASRTISQGIHDTRRHFKWTCSFVLLLTELTSFLQQNLNAPKFFSVTLNILPHSIYLSIKNSWAGKQEA